MKEIEEEILKDIITKLCGKTAAIVVPILKDKNNVDEFKIAEKAGLTINQARNVLYKLQHSDLVSFTRKKDKKKGWFIYFWTLNKERAIRLLREYYQKLLEEAEHTIKSRHKKNFYVCPRGHIELSHEAALEQNFECDECGELLILKSEEAEMAKKKKESEVYRVKVEELDKIIAEYNKASTKAVKREVRKKKKDAELRRKKMRTARKRKEVYEKRKASKKFSKIKKDIIRV